MARQTLLQMASLPDASRNNSSQWTIEVPLATPQGSAVAQFVIERDGGNTTGVETPKPVWRVRFVVDVEPLGPVRANIALSGDRAWVGISAERQDSLEKLRTGSGWLNDALQASELSADLQFQSSSQKPAAVPAGQFLDHAS